MKLGNKSFRTQLVGYIHRPIYKHRWTYIFTKEGKLPS